MRPVGQNRLKDILDFLKGAEVVKYGSASPEKAIGHEVPVIRLLETVRRQLSTVRDVLQITGLDVETVQSVLDKLVASGNLAVK